eukprot:SAG11_NODE_38776_length_250_cov_5.529801_1_plen_43_part_01
MRLVRSVWTLLVNQTQNRPDLTDFGICLYPASFVCTPHVYTWC